MKKQEAVDFIREELAKARTLKQISADLSLKLDAPQDVVEKFVKKVADETVAVDFLTSDVIHTTPAPPLIDQTRFESALAMEPNEAKTKVNLQEKTPQDLILKSVYAIPSGKQQMQSSAQKFEFIPTPNYDEAAVEKFVLRELGRQRKQSDVVIRLCEETGMHWGQAQKVVARVAARNSKKLATNQNLIIIPLSIIALVAGIALLAAVISEIYSLQTLVVDPASLSSDELQYLYGDSRQLLWAFIMGITLGIGGLVGLVLAIKRQLE